MIYQPGLGRTESHLGPIEDKPSSRQVFIALRLSWNNDKDSLLNKL